MGRAACEALRTSGFEAAYRLSATEAFITCQERKPALVITEYRLAEGSGLDFLKMLHHLADAPPVLMLSALGEAGTAAEAMRLGALKYEKKTAAYIDSLPALALEHLLGWRTRRQEAERQRQKQRLESQNELAGWMTHNFRNILAASIGYLNLIDFDNPEQAEDRRRSHLVDSIQTQQSAIELLEKIDGLTKRRDFSDTQTLDVGEVVAEAWAEVLTKVMTELERNRPKQAEQVRARFSQLVFFNSARRLPAVEMVRSDLFDAVQALLRNALEAVMRAEAPRVLVLGEKVDDRLELTVRDNGLGMDEDVLRHATEALYSTKGEVGVGLGLSLVNTIAARYEGDLTFKSSPGKGTAARLSLKVDWH